MTNFKEKTVSNEYTTKRSFQSYNILLSEKLEEDDIGWWHTVSIPNSYRNNENCNKNTLVDSKYQISDTENRTKTLHNEKERILEGDNENGCEPNQSENLDSLRFFNHFSLEN